MRATAMTAGTALLMLVLLSAATAQIPQAMNYQVMITDPDDQPLPGMHELVFRIYTMYEGG
jgi:hypothetical protein